MAREITIISSSTGIHYLLFGLEANEFSNFGVQLYITHFGARAVDWVQSLSLSWCSIMGGNIYLHNSDDVERGNFYGEQKDFKVGVVANQEPSLVKVLDSIGIHTDGTWEVESVVVPANLNYPNGMYSRIPLAAFKKREGILSADFKRNMMTSSGTIKAIEALTGEQMRGKEAYIILKHTGGSGEVQIWEVNINYSKSR